LRFRVYNPGKITKYGKLVQMVCESSTRYICNLQISDGKCGLLIETVGSLLKPYEGKGYHLYQDNYYNSVHHTNELLQKLIRVCGTIRVNPGLLKEMIEEAKKFKKGEVTFCRNQEILLISHQDKRLINMISTLHTAEVIETTSIFNSYVTFSKTNPNSCKSFLDFMSDITENLIPTSNAVSSLSSSSDVSLSSSRTPTPTPKKCAPKNDPPGRLDGKLKNHKLVHIPPIKNYKTPT